MVNVQITKSYNDSVLRRVVRVGEELAVSEARATTLEKKGVAAIASTERDKKIAELEAQLAERDKKIAELEKKK